MLELLEENPLLTLFLVISVGAIAGRIKVLGVQLGIAAVLFAGLAVGALDDALKLPEIVYQFGLVLFVYTVGLNSGPVLVSSFKGGGLKHNLLALFMLSSSAAMALYVGKELGFSAQRIAGLFSGALTNTPALANVLDYLKHYGPSTLPFGGSNEPVVAYSVAYPIGVLGPILAILLLRHFWKVDFKAEAKKEGVISSDSRITSANIKILNPEICDITLTEIFEKHQLQIIFVRRKRGNQVILCMGDTTFSAGDSITVVGVKNEIERAALVLGEFTHEAIDLDRSVLDYRRIFVSNPELINRPLRELMLPERMGAIITRVKRGDIDFMPGAGTILQLGDRVRVVCQREKIDALGKFFGDSYRAVSEVDILTYGLGLAIGIVVGAISVPMPGGGAIRLGLAGGPLVVAVILSALRRTGPFFWALPYSVNNVISQLGLVLFLAGIGTRSGYAFVSTLLEPSGILIFVAGIAVTCMCSLGSLIIGCKIFKISFSRMIGLLAAIHTQPAVLAFAKEQADNELPMIGYGTVFPLSTLAKIILAQALLFGQ